MKRHVIVCILLTIIISAMIAGCGKESTYLDHEKEMKSSVLENKNQYNDALVELIRTGEIAEDNQFIESYMVFHDEDVVSDAELKQCYHTYSAVYIQVNDDYMYRFQLNSDKKIESYIKYGLEA